MDLARLKKVKPDHELYEMAKNNSKKPMQFKQERLLIFWLVFMVYAVIKTLA